MMDTEIGRIFSQNIKVCLCKWFEPQQAEQSGIAPLSFNIYGLL